MRIRLVLLGRTRRAEVRALFDDYVARVGRYAPVDVHELRAPSALAKLKVDTAATWVLLDAAGQALTSQEFARWMGAQRDRGTRELVFLCGEAEGFPREAGDALAGRAVTKLSLSSLTMAHELARVVLAEQIYRAFTILAGHPYSK
ncbi:MAG TPA: 23S rRNA (pseudouridine(1915)-N(3))-methyltransferase RlmH [Candidatus Acidoferrales bacterium]